MLDNKVIIINKLKRDQEFVVKDREKKTFVVFLIEDNRQSGVVRIIIKGKRAEVRILGIIIGYGKQEIKLYTLQDHLKPESTSDLLIKSVLFDSAKLYYKGLIKIEKSAQKSNAYQKNQNLLIGEKAWADSRPYLEILANDIRCTHGTTIGKIDKNQLYYLSTRGLTRNLATNLIIEGFYQEVLDRINDDKIREDLSNSTRRCLAKLKYV